MRRVKNPPVPERSSRLTRQEARPKKILLRLYDESAAEVAKYEEILSGGNNALLSQARAAARETLRRVRQEPLFIKALAERQGRAQPSLKP
jgi:hypothetical protein